MLNKFNRLPLSVKMAIIFLLVLITTGAIFAPYVVIPALVVFFAVASLFRIFIYLVHQQ